MRLLIVLLLPLLVLCLTDEVYDNLELSDDTVEVPECGENEVWMECASCEQTCGQKPKQCPRVCQPARCQCPAHKGFQRNDSGDCVKKC